MVMCVSVLCVCELDCVGCESLCHLLTGGDLSLAVAPGVQADKACVFADLFFCLCVCALTNQETKPQ